MSLNFDVSLIKDYPVVTAHPLNSKKWHPVTEALVLKSMVVDLGTITEDNVDEWEFRIRLNQFLEGAEVYGPLGEDIYITREDIEMHIGLRTNVSTLPRKRWLERTLKGLYELWATRGKSTIMSNFPKVNQGKSAYMTFAEACAMKENNNEQE